jgi:hypothetical protein
MLSFGIEEDFQIPYAQGTAGVCQRRGAFAHVTHGVRGAAHYIMPTGEATLEQALLLAA